jgi:hypothetical protein
VKRFPKVDVESNAEMSKNDIQIGDNDTGNIDKYTELEELLKPIIKNPTFLEQILTATELTDDIKEVLVTNFDEVETKLNSLRGKQISIASLVNLLIQIATKNGYDFDHQQNIQIAKTRTDRSDEIRDEGNRQNDIISQRRERERLAQEQLDKDYHDVLDAQEQARILAEQQLKQQQLDAQNKQIILADLEPIFARFPDHKLWDDAFIAVKKSFNPTQPDANTGMFKQTVYNSRTNRLSLAQCENLYNIITTALRVPSPPAIPPAIPLPPVGTPVGTPTPSKPPSRPPSPTSATTATPGSAFPSASPNAGGSGLLRRHDHKLNDKYFIDRNKLGNGILEIRYNKNRHLTPIKSQYLSSHLKALITFATDHKTIDKSIYNRLTEQEKNLFRTLIPYLDIKDGGSINDGFHKEFEIIRGEILAGNDSKLLKRKAKTYLLHALQTGLISRHNYTSLVFELDI